MAAGILGVVGALAAGGLWIIVFGGRFQWQKLQAPLILASLAGLAAFGWLGPFAWGLTRPRQAAQPERPKPWTLTTFGRAAGAWLWSALGGWPAAIFKLILWAAFVASLATAFNTFVASLATPFKTLFGPGSSSSRFTTSLDSRTLILAVSLAAAAFHRQAARPAPRDRAGWARAGLLALALAAAAYLLAALLLNLPGLLGAPQPETVAAMPAASWGLIVITLTLALAANSQWRLPVGLQVVITGLIGGALMVITLAGPAYAWIIRTFVSGAAYAGPAHERAQWAGSLLAAMAGLAVGPATVLWARPGAGAAQKGAAGAAAGAIAGGALFGLLGTPLASIAAHAPLLEFALAPASYSGSEWILRLALTVLYMFPTQAGVMWLCLTGGALVGGLTALFTPRLGPAAPERAGDWLSEIVGSIGVLLVVALSLIVILVVLALLPWAVQNILDAFGAAPFWSSGWILPLETIPYAILILLWQAAAAVWYRTRLKRFLAAHTSSQSAPIRSTVIWSGISLALGGPLLVLFLLINIPELGGATAFRILTFIALAISLEILLAIRAATAEPALDGHPAEPPAWTAAGLPAALLVGILSYQFIACGLGLVLISVVLIAPLAGGMVAPLEMTYLERDIFSPLFVTGLASFPVYALIHLFYGFTPPFGWRPAFVRRRLEATTFDEAERPTLRDAIQRRLARGPAADRLAIAASALGALLIPDPLAAAGLTCASALFVTRGRRFRRIPWPVLGLAFGLGLAGIVSLPLKDSYHLPLEPLWSATGEALMTGRIGAPVARLLFALLVGPAVALTCRALADYAALGQRTLARLGVYAGLALLIGLATYFSQDVVTITGGVSRYDGQSWESLTAGNSALGGRLNYSLLEDSQGQLWFGGGVVAVRADESGWHPHQLSSITSNSFQQLSGDVNDLARAELLGTRLQLLEDQQGRLWVGGNDIFGQLDFQAPLLSPPLRAPGRVAPETTTGSSCQVGAVARWDGETPRILLIDPSVSVLDRADLSPDGTRLVAGAASGRSSRLYDLQPARLIAVLQGRPGGFNSQADRIVTANSSFGGQGGGVQVWNGPSGRFVQMLENSGSGFSSAAFSPDGRLIAAGGSYRTQLWTAASGAVGARLQHGAGEPFAFSPDGALIATASDGQAIQLWDASTGEPVRKLEGQSPAFGGAGGVLTAIAFSPDGRQVATGDQAGLIRVWDATGGSPVLGFRHTDEITSLRFSADGSRLVSASHDCTARLWNVVDEMQTASFGNERFFVYWADFMPDGDLLTAGCLPQGGYEKLELPAGVSVVDIAQGANGEIWLATRGAGVYQVDGAAEPENSNWQQYTAGSGLPPGEVRALHVDHAGRVWLKTAGALSFFDGAAWAEAPAPAELARADQAVFFEDSQGRLWAGTEAGIFARDGEAWTTFDYSTGWPGGSVSAIFEDSQGGVWAGASSGVLRFDGQRWVNLVPASAEAQAVEAFAEGPAGVVWFGGPRGLQRYNLATGRLDLFDSANSSLAADSVHDLLFDSHGTLWVSTFERQRTARSPWWTVGLGGLFFAYLFAQSYRGYGRTAEARAQRLRQQLLAGPRAALGEYHRLLQAEADAGEVLRQLVEQTPSAERGPAANLAKALAALAAEPEAESQLEAALSQLAVRLGEASEIDHARELRVLYSFLAQAAACRTTGQMAAWPLRVLRSGAEARPMLVAETSEPAALPDFIGAPTVAALEALGQAAGLLSRYRQVDSSHDRLVYLADALSACQDRALASAAQAPLPEGPGLRQVARGWAQVIRAEMNNLSGRAELRLSLRSRQARRAAGETQVALRLQNTGRAVAENVAVRLRPGEGYSLAGQDRFALAQLSSGGEASIEFAIQPGEQETARLAFDVSWDDRVAGGNSAEFADQLRFYDVAADFKRIPNPYIVGHPLKSAEMFQGREDVFQFIAENLGGPVQDRTLVLHGQRRTGKTSILYQLLQGRLGQRFIPVLVDMQEMALLVNHTADFLSEIAYLLARAARKAGVVVEAPAPETFTGAPTRAFNRFLDDLEDSLGERSLLVMFDEFELIESKIAEGKLDANLLNYLRSLIQHRSRLVFLFTGTHRLEEMSHDYWSILFNIALYRRVSFLAPAEAARLVRAPVAGALDVDELAVEKIVALASGHPYFTQLLCWALVNHCNAQQRNYASLNDVNDAVQEILTSGEAHFAYIWQQAGALERLALASLAHSLGPGKEWARPAEVLEALQSAGGQVDAAARAEAFDRAAQRLSAAVEQAVGAEAQSIWLVDSAAETLVCRFAVGPRADSIRQVSVPLGVGIVGACVANQEAILIADAQQDSRFFHAADEQEASFATRSLLTVPVLLEGKAIGAIQAVNRRDGAPFSPDDLERLRGLAGEAAQALAPAGTQAATRPGYDLTLEAVSDALDRLAAQEVLAAARDGALRYRFRVDVLRLWIEATKSISALIERWLRGLP